MGRSGGFRSALIEIEQAAIEQARATARLERAKDALWGEIGTGVTEGFDKAEVVEVSATLGMVRAALMHRAPDSKTVRRLRYEDYLRSEKWKKKRTEILEARGRRCQLCSDEGVELNVHHNTYERLGDERDEDLIVLCRPCHAQHHRKDGR